DTGQHLATRRLLGRRSHKGFLPPRYPSRQLWHALFATPRRDHWTFRPLRRVDLSLMPQSRRILEGPLAREVARFGTPLALGLALAGPIVRDVVGAKGEVAAVAERYLRVMVGGSFTIFFLLQLTTIQRALGSSKTPVSLLVGGNVLNVVLAIILIYGPGPAPA